MGPPSPHRGGWVGLDLRVFEKRTAPWMAYQTGSGPFCAFNAVVWKASGGQSSPQGFYRNSKFLLLVGGRPGPPPSSPHPSPSPSCIFRRLFSGQIFPREPKEFFNLCGAVVGGVEPAPYSPDPPHNTAGCSPLKSPFPSCALRCCRSDQPLDSALCSWLLLLSPSHPAVSNQWRRHGGGGSGMASLWAESQGWVPHSFAPHFCRGHPKEPCQTRILGLKLFFVWQKNGYGCVPVMEPPTAADSMRPISKRWESFFFKSD